MKQDGIPSVKGELREVSVLFADIEGFTTVSEKLDPESTVACLNRLFSKVNSVIFSERGTINKYIGDAVMAFWGAPQTNEKHAASSCSAALGMLVATEQNAKEGLRLRIGIATGEALIGNVGDERFSDYTVMGDRVNFASRLEGLTRKYGVSVLVSERTAKIVGKDFLLREIDSVKVKGKVRAEKIYELMKRDGDASIDDRRLARRHERALSSYRSGDFDAARKEFAKNAAFGDLPAKVFMDRMDGWNGSPPKGFDGSYSFDSK
ncbi:MAG: hypothetical protein QG650_491 [Patescibacteria group bacterium]|nr:hypothetical protein [Patescibacteria group bacterium]